MKTRYSYLIKPIQILIDLLIISLVIYIVSDKEYLNIPFLSYITFFWLVSSFISKFYVVYRYTKFLRLLNLIVRQILIFTLGYFAFFGIFREGVVVNNQFLILFLIVTVIVIIKFLIFFLLKIYRKFGNNHITNVVLGDDSSTRKIKKLFNTESTLGYKLLGYFSDTPTKGDNYLGKVEDVYKYLEINNVNEIYASISELSKEQIKKIRKYSHQNNIQLKLIPNPDELYSKNQEEQFYNDTIKVFEIKKLPFEVFENRFIKRIFDILFSFFVILFLMSWLTPVLWVLIKLESKGPLFFMQEREGLNGEKFMCFKFRSMKKNNQANEIHAKKNDARVTKMGAFIRKTSIDELPQFFNVFLGDMSVVGPRPHMRSLAIEYQQEVDNYMDRHAVKPGITGLAQVSGYRGEIKKKSDIKNRVRLDIFYIENGSFFLDIKIIIRTIVNVFQGEENAY